MSDLQYIAKLLLDTTSTSTSDIRSAENELELLSKKETFIEQLLNIPLIEELISLVGCVYCLRYARNLVLWRDQGAINVSWQKMLVFITRVDVAFKYKEHVAKAMEYLVQNDSHNIIVNAYLSNTFDLLTEVERLQGCGSFKEINLEYVVLISEILCVKVVPSVKIAEGYLNKSFGVLCGLIGGIWGYVGEYVNNWGNGGEAVVEKALSLIEKILQVLKKYIKRFVYFSVGVVEVLYSANFTNIIPLALNFNLPNNKLSNSLFYLPAGPKLSLTLLENFHTVKSLVIYILSQSIRLLINTKMKRMEGESEILLGCGSFIEGFINSVNGLLEVEVYWKLNKGILKVIEEIYAFLIVGLRSCRFYTILHEMRSVVIYSVLFKTLAFCPADYNNYYDDPEEFCYNLLQIVEINQGGLAGSVQATGTGTQEDEIEDYATLKTQSANLLKNYILYIDGTLIEIVFYITNVLEDKINIELSKNLMLLILCVVRDEMKERNDLIYRIKKIIYANLRDLERPTKSVEEPYSTKEINYEDIQYSMNLLVIARFFILFDSLTDESPAQKTFALIEGILKDDKVEEVGRIFGAEIVMVLLRTEDGSLYCRKTVQLLNEVMSVKGNLRLLKCIKQIIQYFLEELSDNDYIFKADYSPLILLCEKMSGFLSYELKTSDKDKEVIYLIWNIFEELVESDHIGGLVSDTVRRVLQPLINLINGENELELEERIYNIMERIVRVTGEVGGFEIQILGILPKVFYVGNRKYNLSLPFALLQQIILNGTEVLSTNLILIKNLILLCVEAISLPYSSTVPVRNELDTLEPILILQSLIVSLHGIFDNESWLAITRSLTKKLIETNVVYDFVKGNIVSSLMLILSLGSKNFSLEDSEQLMSLILKESGSLVEKWIGKIFMIGLSGLLQNFELSFVGCRFVQLLDCGGTLLHFLGLQRQGESERELSSEYQHYQKLIDKVNNVYTGLDEFDVFRSSIFAIREKNMQYLDKAIAELPATKQEYLRNVLNTRKVNNQARTIYKFKNKNGNRNVNSNEGGDVNAMI